jgi:general secretion pathway protein C
MESDDPTWSMATIRDLDSNSLGPYTANEQVRPGVTILAVERGRVVLLNQGRREFITLGAEPPAPAPTKPAALTTSAAKPSARGSVALDGAEQAIDCANENSCTVDRKFVDQLMKNPQQLMTQARMYPVTQDGETQGFRVSGVRSGSLATMIGLMNGDVVSEINGSKLGTIDDALAMYQKLRRANHLSVTVQRGGAVITKEISIK